MVDVVYIAASSLDARFTRICVASLRYFYPDVPIEILVGGRLRSGLARELREYWNVGIAELPEREYGWGFVKLEPLFGPPGRRFLVLDSDTLITGPVLNVALTHSEDFIVDDEVQSSQRAGEIYYDCAHELSTGLQLRPPEFLFNTGQWFGRSGVLTREDFGRLVRWTHPRTPAFPEVFKNGEQGILNYVVNESWRAGRLRVARVPLMCWPGHGMRGLSVERILARDATPLVVHWAGLRGGSERNLPAADMLAVFEDIYYARVRYGSSLQLSRLIARRLESYLASARRLAPQRVKRIIKGQTGVSRRDGADAGE